MPSAVKLFAGLAALAAAGYGGARLGFETPVGIGIAALLLGGLRLAPGLFLGVLLAHAAAPAGWRPALAVAAGTTLAAMTAAWLTARHARGRAAFERVPDLFKFAAFVVGAAAIGAAGGVAGGILSASAAPVVPMLLAGWLAHAAAGLVIAPALVLLVHAPAAAQRPVPMHEIVGAGLGLGLVVAFLWGGLSPAAARGYPLEFLTLPPLLWSAFRFGPRATAVLVLTVAAVAVAGTLSGLGPFSRATAPESAALLQVFTAVVGTTALAVAALVSERSRALTEARANTAALERRVSARTAALETAAAELAATRDAAVASARAKARFLANISHEIRTPINGIAGMVELLLKSPLTRDQKEIVSTVQASTDSLLALVNDVLDLSKVESGRLALESAAVDLPSLVEDTVCLLAPRGHAKGVDVVVHVDPSLGEVTGDPLRLRQVLSNLVSNAIKFTEDGEVVVRVSARRGSGDPRLVFEVEDTGIGIAPEALERLGDAFTQADASTSRKYGGSGLGLAIARQVTERMGGQLTARSTPGRGSCFTFTVPLEEAAPVPPERFAGRVLVIERRPSARDAVSARIAAWGCEVTSVGEAEDARVVLDSSGPFDTIVLGISAAGSSASELVAKLHAKARLAGTRMIVLVPLGREAEAAGLDVDALVPKPLRAARLLAAFSGRGLEPARAEAPTALVPEEAPVRRILLVEDNEVNQRVALMQLEGLAAQVDLTRDGHEAVAAVLQNEYDLVLMDCQMPGLDGYEAARTIRAQESGRRTPIVALTAAATAEERAACLAAGMDECLAKPVRPEELQATVDRFTVGAPEAPVEWNRVRLVTKDEGSLRDLLRVFLDDADRHLSGLRDAVAGSRARDVQRFAHTLAGASGNLGMPRILPPLRELERMGREGTFAGAHTQLEVLASEIARIREDLSRRGYVGG